MNDTNWISRRNILANNRGQTEAYWEAGKEREQLLLIKKITIKPYLIRHLIALFLMLLLHACDKNNEHGKETKQSEITLQVWAHAGQAAERKVLKKQVAQFNQQKHNIEIKLTFIPERDYNAQVQAAALAGDLPDILEFDGPYLYNYIWQQHLLPLESLLPASLINDLLPSIVKQGT